MNPPDVERQQSTSLGDNIANLKSCRGATAVTTAVMSDFVVQDTTLAFATFPGGGRGLLFDIAMATMSLELRANT